MKYKFRLREIEDNKNKIYEFDYEGYSDLIESLEPEPDSVIDVLEEISEDDFRIGEIEYKKYLSFKKGLNEIVSMENLRSIDELMELGNYNLENRALKWLTIEELRSEKVIKLLIKMIFNKDYDLYRYGFNFSDFLKKSYKLGIKNGELLIIVCWIGGSKLISYDDSFSDLIKVLCKMGHLNVVKWYDKLKNIRESRNSFKYLFGDTCLSPFNIDLNDEEYLELLNWIIDIYKLHFEDGRSFFVSYFENSGNYYLKMILTRRKVGIKTVEWLLEIWKDYLDFSKNNIVKLFNCLIGNEDFEMVKWFYYKFEEKLKDVINYKHIVYISSLDDRIERSEWIYSIIYGEGREIKYDENEVNWILAEMGRRGIVNTFNWFYELLDERETYNYEMAFKECVSSEKIFRLFCKNLYDKGLIKKKINEMISVRDYLDMIIYWMSSIYKISESEDYIELMDWLYEKMEEELIVNYKRSEEWRRILDKDLACCFVNSIVNLDLEKYKNEFTKEMEIPDEKDNKIKWLLSKRFFRNRINEGEFINELLLYVISKINDKNWYNVIYFYNLINKEYEKRKIYRKIDIHYNEDKLIKKVVIFDNLNLFKWMCSLDEYTISTMNEVYQKSKKTPYQIIRRWLDSKGYIEESKMMCVMM